MSTRGELSIQAAWPWDHPSFVPMAVVLDFTLIATICTMYSSRILEALGLSTTVPRCHQPSHPHRLGPVDVMIRTTPIWTSASANVPGRSFRRLPGMPSASLVNFPSCWFCSCPSRCRYPYSLPVRKRGRERARLMLASSSVISNATRRKNCVRRKRRRSSVARWAWRMICSAMIGRAKGANRSPGVPDRPPRAEVALGQVVVGRDPGRGRKSPEVKANLEVNLGAERIPRGLAVGGPPLGPGLGREIPTEHRRPVGRRKRTRERSLSK
mmetsp:Transcript_13996/g.40197  ORF Transcript_13996/g.40197 Transcript_13996/m.40197 type:complete len:269 (-) Transcript_13996:485-1291(-)